MPAPRIPKGGTRGAIYRPVAWLRLADAKSLLDRSRYNGAIYLAGYAVECHLKYAVCEKKNILYLPAHLEVHDWDILVKSAGLIADIKAQPQVSHIYDALAERWGPALRYRTGKYTLAEASHLYTEMTSVYEFLRELVP
jgi:hypothetical protein